MKTFNEKDIITWSNRDKAERVRLFDGSPLDDNPPTWYVK